jgi:hypothetical protein
MINIANVERVYSGRIGCMCGCKGKYSETLVSIKRMVNKLSKEEGVEYDSQAGCYHLQTDTRQYAVYMKEGSI